MSWINTDNERNLDSPDRLIKKRGTWYVNMSGNK